MTDSKPKTLMSLLSRHRYLHRGYGKDPEPRKRVKGTLDKQAVLLLIVQGLYTAATALSILFVNVFIWKLSRDYALLGWFALSQHVSGAFTFYFAGKWVKEYNKMNSLRVGIALSAALYLLILLLGDLAAEYAIWIGCLQGISSSFFWLAFNVVYFEITEPDNRDRFNGMAGFLGAISGMVAPWLSGFTIHQLGDQQGYSVIFGASFIIFVLGVIFSFFLKKRKVEGCYEWTYAFKQLTDHHNPWRKIFFGMSFQGIREGVFMFLVGLLVYTVTNNEFRLGSYSFITSGVSLVSFWLLGKWMNPALRVRFMVLGTFALSLVMLPLFIQVNYLFLLLFGIGTSLFYPMFAIPITSTVFDLIGRDDSAVKHRVEYVVLRETGLNAGRIIGILLYIAFVSWIGTERELPLVSFMMLIGSAPIVTGLLMSKMEYFIKKVHVQQKTFE